ncbi:AfsR/SARP family transcriptional regulator [Agromyces kandeliae]|uniref:AfsR/SARP family transcriptional regulator n=1 Tax=Agromyces kandeliae TaxID=2666141 RepID=UPI0018A1F283|nr:BTAD domain-containing putative transcriptional regulator [Agromyces kandeliae]
MVTRLQARLVFVVAPAGAGKSTLIGRLESALGRTSVVSATTAQEDPDRLRSAIEGAAADGVETVAVDDAGCVAGTPAEAALERVLGSAQRMPRLVLASRLPLPSSIVHAAAERSTTITAPELGLRIDEISLLFGEVAGRPLGLGCASRVAQETAGWPALIELLARRARRVDPDAVESMVEADLASDFAAGCLETALEALPSEVRHALERTSELPRLDFTACARVLGATGAGRLLGAVDSGSVMHEVVLGHRVVPPVLRRHLGECRTLEGATSGSAAASSPPVMSPTPSPADVANAPDRAPAPVGDPVGAAIARLRRGDIVGAIPLLRRIVDGGTPAQARSARLALLVIREPLTPRDTTLDALAALERECVEAADALPARVCQGAIAAIAGLPSSAVRGIVDSCDTEQQALAAASVAGVDLVVRLRRGQVTSARAAAVADRFDRIGYADVAAWARSCGALAAAASGSEQARELIVRADGSVRSSGADGARAVLEVAQSLAPDRPGAGSGTRTTWRRRALETGLPRLPSLVTDAFARQPHGTPSDWPGTTASRLPRLTVECFGGFHLRADGTEIDLRTVRPQARALLRMLALNSGAPVHRELIAGILWGDLGTESAVHALHVSVSSLRRALPRPRADDDSSIVERVGEAYRLGVLDRRDCDLADFDDHLADAAAAKRRGDAESTAHGLRSALDRYTGEVLPEDGPAEWVTGARERYRLRASEAAASLAHLELRLGSARTAVATATRAVDINPWLDEAWRTLVEVQRRSGDVLAAERAAEGYRRMRVELGVD